MMTTSRGHPQYFVCHLPEGDRAPNQVRSEVLQPISVELGLSGGGLSGQRAYMDLDATELLVGEHRVPDAVLRAAKALPVGEAQWVDEHGEPAGFF